MDGMTGLNFNISAYRENTKTKYSQLNWEAIAHIFIVLPALITIVATCNVKSNYYHKLIRLLAPTFALASGIRLFFVAEEVNQLNGKIATLNQQEELELKQALGTNHWRQGKVLGAIAQSQLAEYLPQQPQLLPPTQSHNALQYAGQNAVHYAGQPQATAYPVAYPQNAYTGNSPSFDLNSTGTHRGLPAIRDLGFEIAQIPRHIIFVASTTSGKTTLITQVIANSLAAGHQVIVIDGKGDRRLVPGVTKYFQANTPDRAVQATTVLSNLARELGSRQDLAMQGQDNFTPITIVIDELNLIRLFLGQDSKDSLNEFTQLLTHILLQGASARIYLRVSAHTSRLSKLGLDGGEADSLSFIALGRNGDYDSIEDCLRYQVLGNKAKKYQDDLDVIVNTEIKETLVFSTLKPMGLFRLPFVNQSPANFHFGQTSDNLGNSGNPYQDNAPSSQAIALETYPGNISQEQKEDNRTLEMETFAVSAMLKHGLSDTEIIKTVLNIKPGRNWESGKQKLEKIKIKLGIIKPTLEIEEAIDDAGYLEKIYQLWDQEIFAPEQVIPIVWGVQPGSSDWQGTIAHYEKLVAAK